jgi:hypothetical protein
VALFPDVPLEETLSQEIHRAYYAAGGWMRVRYMEGSNGNIYRYVALCL